MFRIIYRYIRLLPKRGKEPYISFSKVLGFYPYNVLLYEQAFLHKSSSMRMKDGRWINNERLEFLGDAILDAIVADIVFKEYEYKKEGFLTTMRSRIVQRESLNKLALDIGIDKFIKTSALNSIHNTHIYGNALEALIGAIYLDQGYRVAKRFVSDKLIQQHLDIQIVAAKEVNFKSKLIEWGQKYKIEIRFDLEETKINEENMPVFKARVFIFNEQIGAGEGYSKKESHQKAAEVAIHKLHTNTLFRNHIFKLKEQQVEEQRIENEIRMEEKRAKEKIDNQPNKE